MYYYNLGSGYWNIGSKYTIPNENAACPQVVFEEPTWTIDTNIGFIERDIIRTIRIRVQILESLFGTYFSFLPT